MEFYTRNFRMWTIAGCDGGEKVGLLPTCQGLGEHIACINLVRPNREPTVPWYHRVGRGVDTVKGRP